MNPNSLKVVQINLHHSEAATDDLLRFMEKEAIHVALIQEPWLVANKVCGIRSRNYILLFPKTKDKIRSCILVRKDIKLFLVSNHSSGDQTVAAFERHGLPTLILTSAYLPYDEVDPPSSAVRELIKWCSKKYYDIVIGCDANAHHTLWGSSDINIRGECLLEYLLSTNLSICNKGNKPTFFNRIREEVIDLTLVSNTDTVKIFDWKVSSECSFSDHNRIIFKIEITLNMIAPFRNPRRTDWEKFGNLTADIQLPQKEMLDSKKELDESVSLLTSTLKSAYESSCKVSHSSKKFHQPWWSPELKRLRRKYRKLLNRAKKRKDPKSWDDCRKSFNKFKRECRRAKRESWKKFCGDLENTSDASRLRKVLSKDPGIPAFLMNSDGSFTESSNETLELLMATHFPGCKDVDSEDSEPEDILTSSNNVSELVVSMINEEKVAWAVSFYDQYKSEGTDGIFPALIQRSLPFILPSLVVNFMSNLELGYIPNKWREVRVVFIPKAGKIIHNTAKDYRSISLSSFLLKILQRLIDVYVRSILIPQNFLSDTTRLPKS